MARTQIYTKKYTLTPRVLVENVANDVGRSGLYQLPTPRSHREYYNPTREVSAPRKYKLQTELFSTDVDWSGGLRNYHSSQAKKHGTFRGSIKRKHRDNLRAFSTYILQFSTSVGFKTSRFCEILQCLPLSLFDKGEHAVIL